MTASPRATSAIARTTVQVADDGPLSRFQPLVTRSRTLTCGNSAPAAATRKSPTMRKTSNGTTKALPNSRQAARMKAPLRVLSGCT